MSLTREDILRRRPLPTEVVPAPELGDGVTLRVRRLNAGEFLALTEKAKADPQTAYQHWIVATVCDDAGQRVFTDDDAPAIAELDIALVERLTTASQRLNLPQKATGPNQQTPPDDSSTPSR